MLSTCARRSRAWSSVAPIAVSILPAAWSVVPTAHYMMGGVLFNGDCSTSLPGLFAAGEDTGGVHGANRLGGNGVANSTVFGAIAGDAMAAWVRAEGTRRAPDEDALQRAVADAEQPFHHVAGDIEQVREALLDCMWEDVGIVRSEAGLARAARRLAGSMIN